MKIRTTFVSVSLIALFVGCATVKRGPAYGHEGQFREQLATNALIANLGYKIEEVRFSQDYQRVLVIFAGVAETNTAREVVLEHDGFQRYKGTLYLPMSRDDFTSGKLQGGAKGIIVDLRVR